MAELIGSIFASIVMLGTIVLAIAYVWSQARKGTNQQTQESNTQLQEANKKLTETLNELINTQAQKIANLEELHKHNQNQISHLEGRVEELSKRNGDLQDIINSALDRYFHHYPDEAIKLATIRSARRSDITHDHGNVPE